MCIRDSPCGEGFTGQEVTLSFCTMFQYIWVGIGKFVESNGFIGNFLLTFIPIMLPFSGCKWKQWKEVFVYSIIVFLAFNLLSYVNYYTCLLYTSLQWQKGGESIMLSILRKTEVWPRALWQDWMPVCETGRIL